MPVHTDEAVNAAILGDMLEGKPYRYDPLDRHGPTLYYATYPLVRALGARALGDLESWQLRLVPAFFGAALIAALLMLEPGIPVGALLAAALWLGLGAPFVYYGRYWIHETLFVLLTFLVLGSCWRYMRTGRALWAVGAGLAGGALVATKETAVISIVGALGALAGTRLVNRSPAGIPRANLVRDIGLGLAFGALVSALLFTSFGRNIRGAADALGSMSPAAARAGGQGHEKPPYAYLAWLLLPGLRSVPWCGWTIVAFGMAGAWTAWVRRAAEPLPFFLLLYTALVGTVYAAIPYKTPWLELNVLAPAAILAGLGFCRAAALCPARLRGAAAAAMALLIAGALGSETRRLCFIYPADPGNPLAYSPTVPDVRRLEDRIERLAAMGGAHPPVVAVVGKDIWPLPWYLRHCTNVGYWPEPPRIPGLRIVVSSAGQSEKVKRTLGPAWKQEIYGLRPEVLAVLFTRSETDPGADRSVP